LLSVYSGVFNQKETVVVEDIAGIARGAFRASGDPHANRGLLVGGITAPVDFLANATSAVFGNSTKAVDRDSLSLLGVGLVGIGVMD
jgi:hypothetical protein